MKEERKMAEIIDLDFYRKFRVVLPVRPAAVKGKSSMVSRIVAKRYRRRQKEESTPKITKEE
jgi:hypothetical protein